MATMKDVAKLAQVSTATVSHVINGTKTITEATRKRVLAAIAEARYVLDAVAKSLRVGSSQTVGVLVEDIRGLPVADIVGGVSEALEQSGYSMLLYDLHLLGKLYNRYEQIDAYRERINHGVTVLTQSHVGGVIYVSMHDRRLEGLFDPTSRPIVFAYAHGSPQESYVTYDNLQSARELVEYLIGCGHERIALIKGCEQSSPSHVRLSGYEQALKAHGLPLVSDYVRQGDWTYESGARETAALLALSPRPTAIFAMNDPMAVGCIHALLDAGLSVPGDVSVVGFDDRESMRTMRPPLTTVSIPTKEIGMRAAQMLLAQLRGESEPEGVMLPCTLVKRGSVRTLNGGTQA